MPILTGIRTKAGMWRFIECGCCAGIEWGGDYPTECRTCGGSGMLWLSPRGRLAHYPGGAFCGMASKSERLRGGRVIEVRTGG